MRHTNKSPQAFKPPRQLPKLAQKIRIAFAFPARVAFIERLMPGIIDYAQQQGGWIFTRAPENLSPSIDWLKEWTGDGAIVLLATPRDAAIARKLPFPVVNLLSYLKNPGVPTVCIDHQAVGALAAEHLLQRHFRRFGFYGTADQKYSEERWWGFSEAVRRTGGVCESLKVPVLGNLKVRWTDQQEELDNWLRQMQPPVAIVGSTDVRADMVLEACRRLNFKVPEDFAVMGIDNDPLVCEFTQPTLSSVSRNDREVGFQAAAFLHNLIKGKSTPKRFLLIPPDKVVERQSTAALAIEDSHVAAAVKYIQEHLGEPFGMERITDCVSISRRRLESRFRASLKCSPYVFINNLRVEQAKKLLIEPKKRELTEIAQACGFTGLGRFRIVFRKAVGISPAAYRLTARQNLASTMSG